MFPHQDALAEGLRGTDLWCGEITEFLPDHVAATFEALCVRYTRERFGNEAPTVGSWWGDALNEERRTGRRTVEEIDIVGAHRQRLRLVGECKWTAKPMRKQVLDDLLTFKLPALLQEGRLTVPKEGLRILLFARSGFDRALKASAASDGRVELVTVEALAMALLD